MSTLRNPRGVVLILLCAAVLLFPRPGWSAAAASKAAPPAPKVDAPPIPPKSVFNSDPGLGKDPFFPSSTRREKLKVVERRPDVQVRRIGVPDWVVLKGFAVHKERKLAIFNNYTVEAGEEFTLKHNGQSLKFKCIEIKENSAVISTDGISKELQLRPGL